MWKWNNIAASLIVEGAIKWPDKVALRCQGQSMTYAELAHKSCAFAQLLRAHEIAPGERIMMAMGDCCASVVIFLGSALAGCVTMLTSDRLLEEDYHAYIREGAPLLILTRPGHAAMRAAHSTGTPCLTIEDSGVAELLQPWEGVFAPHPVQAEDVCTLHFTSGTTGHPKGVPHTHADCHYVAHCTGQDFLGYRHDDVALCSAKTFHVYGFFVSVLCPLLVGATTVLDPAKPSPEETMRLVRDEHVSIFASTPVILSMLLMLPQCAATFQATRICISAGESLPAALFHAWRNTVGQELWEGYGSTETMTMVVGAYPPRCMPGAAGKALPPYEVRVVDDAFVSVPDGVEGLIVVKGPSLMRGYWNAPEWTARAFTPDGWLQTGDVGIIAAGVLTIVGRKNDMFKVGGLWVPPGRVEDALLSHPAVAQCAVTAGMSGPFTLVRAHVVLASGFSPSEEQRSTLRVHAAERVPDCMAPADIVFHDSLPLTASGKVQRFKLRQDA